MAAEVQSLQAGKERRGSNASQTGDCCLEAAMRQQFIALNRIEAFVKRLQREKWERHRGRCQEEKKKEGAVKANKSKTKPVRSWRCRSSGDRLPNLGEKKLDVTTSDGQAATATYQAADVTRALCAVSRICDKGNTVTFQAEGGFIENPDGVRTHFRRENNVYVMDLYVKEPLSQSVFGRQS